ncbi:hypothetical protein MNBD_NITROSPIRAE01-771 [hydrothermal vent metagenome]|uniref:Peptidoglycan binding-like domain-containing protein n=1 Tax=hydrothermal vent metagenome TaxID=652676 RepID=A0A3B1CED1_9ZZZZ
MLPSGAVATPASSGEFCDGTQKALKKFQQFSGLSVTGVLDQKTVALMSKKRCGHLDVGAYAAQGNKWNRNNLRYGFVDFTGDLSQTAIRNAIINPAIINKDYAA